MENPKEIIKELIEKHQKKKDEKQRLAEERMIKLREKRLEKEANKPRYKINNLYVGEIIYIQSQEYFVGPNSSIWDSGIRNKYYIIKKFAIFDKADAWKDYIHIGTNHSLRTDIWAKSGEYCICNNSLREFDKAMQSFMIANKLTKDSNLSINQIKEIETGINEKFYPNQNQNQLFW